MAWQSGNDYLYSQIEFLRDEIDRQYHRLHIIQYDIEGMYSSLRDSHLTRERKDEIAEQLRHAKTVRAEVYQQIQEHKAERSRCYEQIRWNKENHRGRW